MYRGTNKTAIESQRQITDALLRLLQDKPFSQISICQICREAGISRQTFYSLFESKENVISYELENNYCMSLTGEVESVSEDTCESIAPCACSTFSLKEICRYYSDYIRSNRAFITLLTENDMIDCMYDSLLECFLSCDGFLAEGTELDRSFGANFLAGGITGVARCYCSKDSTEADDEDGTALEELLYSLLSGKYFE